MMKQDALYNYMWLSISEIFGTKDVEVIRNILRYSLSNESTIGIIKSFAEKISDECPTERDMINHWLEDCLDSITMLEGNVVVCKWPYIEACAYHLSSEGLL